MVFFLLSIYFPLEECIIYTFIGNLLISSMISQSDIVSITKLTLMLKIIGQYDFDVADKEQ